MRRLVSMTSVLVMLGALGLPARAEQAAPVSGLRAELIAELTNVEKKLVDLAQAMPQEKYGWRPGDGVRSVSEVYMHIAGGNVMIPSMIGVKPPAGIDRDMEKTVTEKAKVIETMKKSFEHVRSALRNTSDADMDKTVKLFGRDSNIRSVYLLLVNHAHEHMGQSIAYARVNKVVPPWSEAQPAPAAKPAAKS